MTYQNGKIYKLICSETGNVYIGSTILTLDDRLKRHTASSNNCMSKTFIKPIIVLIKEYPCNNKTELEKEEVIFIKEVNCVNKVIPGRTQRQWYLDTQDRIKQYRLDNKEKFKEKFNCECGGKFTYASKSKHLNTSKHQMFLLTKYYKI